MGKDVTDRWGDFNKAILSLGYDPANHRLQAEKSEDFATALRDGTAWDEFADAVKSLGAFVKSYELAGSDLELAEGYRYLMGLVAQRLITTLYACGPDEPAFVRGMDDTIKIGLDNPDGINCLIARVDPDKSYRISGKRGGERYVEFVQFGTKGTLANNYLTEFEVDTDGAFEIALDGQEKPGNWLRLHDEAVGFYVRLIHYDWDSPATEIYVDRVDGDGFYECLRRPTAAQVGQELQSLASILPDETEFWLDYARSFAQDAENGIGSQQSLATSGNSAVRAAPKGVFRLAPDEALILTLEPPGGMFWSVMLNDVWFRTLEPSRHQTSLNGAMAEIDSDGLYRFVIAHKDPGVANWLDTLDHERGFITIRYVKTENRPPVASQLVKFDELGSVLPADTKRVSPQERAKALAARTRGFAKRYAAPPTSRWRR